MKRLETNDNRAAFVFITLKQMAVRICLLETNDNRVILLIFDKQMNFDNSAVRMQKKNDSHADSFVLTIKTNDDSISKKQRKIDENVVSSCLDANNSRAI